MRAVERYDPLRGTPFLAWAHTWVRQALQQAIAEQSRPFRLPRHALWDLHEAKSAQEQLWQRTDLGFHGPFPTITGGIFEPGFPDCFLQMWAAFLAERAGALEGRFGCVTPDEAVQSHELFAAALRSHAEKRAIELA